MSNLELETVQYFVFKDLNLINEYLSSMVLSCFNS